MTPINSQEIIAESLQRIDRVFRGSLIIQGNDVLKWTLYFRLGHLSWATGGLNFHERLQRNLAIFCPQITSKVLKQIPVEYQPDREQQILVHLQGQGLITRSQMTSLMENIAVEVLFDAIQYGETNIDRLSCNKITAQKNNNLLLLLPVLDINLVFHRARTEWNRWQSAWLENYSPNLYPIIQQPDILKRFIKNSKQQKIINSINGNRTLRGLAIKSKQNIIDLTLFLISLIDSGAIIFANSPETSTKKIIKAEKEIRKNSKNLSLKQTLHNQLNIKQQERTQAQQHRLIACIDDSPLVCQKIKDIVIEQKYNFIDIQEAIQAIPILLEKKPDLVFLDLMMPVINGYEICARMRKIPSLENIPVVIFAEKNSLVDRMRAKLVGSTDFVAKPIKTFPILQILDKYIIANQ